MIIQEHFTVNGIDYIRTYSDAGRYVVGGEPYGAYDEACDPAEFGRVYTEGDLIPTEEWPEWVQPTGTHDAYEAGKKVSHNGKDWINTYGDGNIWEPGVFGWDPV